MKILTKIANCHYNNIVFNILSTDRQGSLRLKPMPLQLSITTGTQTRYLKFLGIGSWLLPGCAYTLTPHLQLYRSGQHLPTSGTAEPLSSAPRTTASPSSKSSFPLLVLPT